MSYKLARDAEGGYYLLDEHDDLLIDFDGEAMMMSGCETFSPYTADTTHLEISDTDANALIMKLLAITGGKSLPRLNDGHHDPWTRWAREVWERAEGTIKP